MKAFNAMCHAFERRDAKKIDELLGNGSHNANEFWEQFSSNGWRLLHQACYRGFPDIVRVLLHHGADVNAKMEPWGWTPLMVSGMAADPPIARLLLEHPEIQIDAVDDMGDTVLLIALRKQHIEVALMLIERGANVEMKNKEGKCAADLIAEDESLRDNPELAAALEKMHCPPEPGAMTKSAAKRCAAQQ